MVSRAGVKLRPTIEREALYHLVLALRKEGLSYNQIIKKIESERGVVLRKSHISGWINGKHNPFGYVTRFEATPRPELAYVIGVYLGDASSSSNKNHDHMIKLRVIDREFALEFSRCLGALLNRTPPRVAWHEKTNSWWTQVSSLLLQRFLRSPIEQLGQIVAHCDECKSAFLRGFFDSEGSVADSGVTASNGVLERLLLVSKSLTSLGVDNTGPHLIREAGGTTIIKGKPYRRNKAAYYIYVRRDAWARFQLKIGFVVDRKASKLATLVRARLENQPKY